MIRSLLQTRSLFLLFLLLPTVAFADTGEWTQFRGSDRNGISAETGLVRAFPEGGPTELWRRPIGAAFSGVAVVDGDLYTTESDDALTTAPSSGRAISKRTSIWRSRTGASLRRRSSRVAS